MTTTKELIYMVLDEIKLMSDDAFYTEDHVRFLLKKHRVYLLTQKYKDIKKKMPDSNYQTLCLDLIEVPAFPGSYCEGTYLRSTMKIPTLLDLGNPSLYLDYYQSNVTLIDKERMKYVGNNKYLQNIIYASIGPDNYLYLTSSNPQFLYLQKIKFTGIFEDVDMSNSLSCELTCDTDDAPFPIEDGLVSLLIQSVVKELLGAAWRPSDQQNDANDNLSDMNTFIRRNIKSAYQKQLDNDE